MLDWETLKNTWPIAVFVGGHIIRTERVRTNLVKDVEYLQKQRQEDRDDIQGMLREIRTDIKSLMRRDIE
jgi:hypothetical protein